MSDTPRLCSECKRHPSACVCADAPTKPSIQSLADYSARVHAYRAVSESELGSLEGPVTTWDAVNVVVDAYNEARAEQERQKRSDWLHERNHQIATEEARVTERLARLNRGER